MSTTVLEAPASRFAAVPVTAGLGATLILAMLVALTVGPADTSLGDVLAALTGRGDARLTTVVMDIRLPRVLLGAIVGAALALSGAALQGLLRNPLADPGVIGVSSSAALGAVVALYFGLAGAFALALPVAAITTALAGTAVLYVLASRDASVLTLILAGVAVSSLATALTSLAMNLSPNPFSLSDIVLWLLGSLSNRSFTDIALAGPFIAVGAVLLATTGRALDALTLGGEAAATLGVNLARLRWVVIAGSALAVGASVAVTGVIGFVGLVVPHLVRPLVGHAPSRILLPSALGGATLLVLADLVIRTAPGSQELKLGVVTALIGAPFFLYLVIATRRAMR